MRTKLIVFCLAVVFAGCTARPHSQIRRTPAGVVAGKVRAIDFSGLTGSTPFVIIGRAWVTITLPESLKGKELEVGSSDDFPFQVGDDVEFDLSEIGIDLATDGALRTEMLYRFPIKVRSSPESPSGAKPSHHSR